MPTLAPHSKILVSGANGYVAVWVVRQLLEAGYAVRGTVRSASKGKHLEELFESYKKDGKLELVVVEDIAKEGAFDEAVKGVDGIAHTASPFIFDKKDPNEFIEPAVKGTTGILQSAYKHGKDIKRIVITSSTAAVLSPLHDTKVFTEADWNEPAIKAVEEKGKDAPSFQWYQASKTLAEKAAWKFYEERKGEVGWDLVVLNPPYVFGPILHEVPNPEALNTSTLEWYKTVVEPNSSGKTAEALRDSGASYIDVRDLADAHKLAFEKEKAGGERIIVSAGSHVWQDWIDTANKVTLSTPRSIPLSKGHPGETGKNAYRFRYDNSKVKEVLGIQFRSFEESTRDTLEDFGRRGW